MLKIETNPQTLVEIAKVIETQGKVPKSVRIFVAGHGCGGPTLGLALDDINEGDVSELQGDIRFVMDRELFETMGDIKVEFMGSGYLVAPAFQEESSCGSGCGGCGCGGH